MDENLKYLEKIKDIVNLSKKKKDILNLSDDEIASLKTASNTTYKQKPSPNKNKGDEVEDDEENSSPSNLNNIDKKKFNKFVDKYDKNKIDLVTVECLRIKQLSEFT